MAFVAVCKALYDYAPQGEGELPIREGELLYVLEKSNEDDWWRAKKKAENEDDEEPEGLVPNNYVEEAHPTHQARALFDYSRQTDEELSFAEDDVLNVYDTSDEDWTLVGFNGEFGFVPANYIEVVGADGEEAEDSEEVASPPLPTRPRAPPQPSADEPESPAETAPNPAANIASILGGKAARTPIAPPQATTSPREESEEEDVPPPMPRRPESQQITSPPPREPTPTSPEPSGVVASPPANRVSRGQSASREAPGGYHLYNINEMVAVMGKMKKMPTTLGINLGLGVIIIMPERKRDGPQQEWTAEKLSHYSIEGKHVFLDLVKPSKSFDFHAGAKETAEEIVAMLGELAGAVRAEGLREVIAAGSGGQKKGQMLYDFMAQGDDEVTVGDGDEVIILDDTLSEEWWKVRRVKNGKEGVVPSSYVEVTGLVSPPPPQLDPSTAAIRSGLSNVERNRREEERLTREALANSKPPDDFEPKSAKRGSRSDGRSGNKSKPDTAKLRMWTDRSGSFKVEAQFIGLKDGKIHLHKVNGVKIAVPIAKMSKTDIEYVERATGKSLDDEKPLADRKGVNGARQASSSAAQASSQQPSKPEYDWFDFFLRCGVSPYQCERYSYNFHKDSMDESVLSDINPTVLRNLGLKEGDILRVMKYLDTQFGRSGEKSAKRNVSFGPEESNGENDESGAGSLFSGPGGALKNNRAKGRPAPAVATSDDVTAQGLEKGARDTRAKGEDRSESPDDRPPPPPKDKAGFEDNAWDVKPVKQPPRPQSQPQTPAQPPPQKATPPPPKAASPPPALTGGMADLSLLTQPLQPTKVSSPTSNNQSTSTSTQQSIPVQQIPQQQQQQQQQQQPHVTQSNQPQGANPSFFNQLNPQQTGLPQAQLQQQQNINSQPTGQFQFNPPRQRPQAPPQAQQGPLMPPPPARPMSAPQNSGPLQGQQTGAIGYMNSTSPPPNVNQLQPMAQLQPQYTSYNLQGQGYNQQQQQFSPQNQLQPQMTGYQPQQQQQFGMNGQQGSSFGGPSLQSQVTGFQSSGMNYHSPSGSGQGIMPQPTGSINSMLPPALQPQSTGAVNGFGRPAFGQPPPPMPSIPSQYQSQQAQPQQQQSSFPQPPPIPQQNTAMPLQPQKTGPAPNVKFGVQPGKKLMAQPTGRKANLAQATPDNPFGF